MFGSMLSAFSWHNRIYPQMTYSHSGFGQMCFGSMEGYDIETTMHMFIWSYVC